MVVEAKVAAIISNREAAFNVGSDSGVEVGHNATIYRVIDVEDPDTGAPLGSVRRPRVRFTITHVQDSLSVGRVLGVVTRPEPQGSLFFGVRPSTSTEKESLRLTDDPKGTDYRTVHVRIGESVEIESPTEEAPF